MTNDPTGYDTSELNSTWSFKPLIGNRYSACSSTALPPEGIMPVRKMSAAQAAKMASWERSFDDNSSVRPANPSVMR